MEAKSKFAFEKTNYMIMIIGVCILAIGFFIMTLDQETFGFGFLGLTLGPIVVFLGFLTQFVAIFYKSKKSTSESKEE